ncbi:CDGSH iron-sulfur domain-containing protein 2 [Aplysia californica]|uniref:CDGSH iron-sulfur domain-containing protein 2 homologue n=1 Tax=Aplysia californica TaxID=6500 RepID=A0ABM0ZZ94_APLCA|nr:CDGSH iron-sulfur domain-containing protein 2 [Aplysia californica]
MESLHAFFKIILPKYLRSLPMPKTLAGYAKLSGEDWMNLIPFVLIVMFMVYSVGKTILSRRKTVPKPKVNQSIQKEDSKVVTQMDIEDIGDKMAFCRCWRSKKFPLCDGSHNQHNSAARDNVGPLLLLRNADDK